MKKLVLLFSILVFGLVTMAQTVPTEVSPDSYITDADYKYLWGTTSDTLTNADTLSHVVRVQGLNVQDLTVKLYSDFVSGTAGGTLVAYSSIDGVNYASTGDTITVSSLTADAMDAEVISISDYLYPYLKFIYLQTGTAVTIPKVYIYTKYN